LTTRPSDCSRSRCASAASSSFAGAASAPRPWQKRCYARRPLPAHRVPDLAVTIRRQQGRAELVISETRRLADDPEDAARIFAFEWLLRLLHGLSCWLAGRGLALDHVIFPYRRPAHAADYALIFTEDSRFAPTVPGGVGTLVAGFNANLLDLPVRRDEAALTVSSMAPPARSPRCTGATAKWSSASATCCAPPCRTRPASPTSPRLHLSPRTIHRRLEDEGSSFRNIKEALRRDMALARLDQDRRLNRPDRSRSRLCRHLGLLPRFR
jgi:hypothetical protein